MSLEDLTGSSKYISDFITTNPVSATDTVQYGADHIRGIKNATKNTFPNVTGAVTATHTELNLIDGYTGNAADLSVMATTAAAGVVANDIKILAGAAAGGLTAAELLYINTLTSNAQTQITNNLATAIARANHTGTQIMSTISNAGSLATLNSIAATNLDANSVIDTKIYWESITSGVIGGTTWVVPAGLYTVTTENSTALTLDVYQGGVWRIGVNVFGGGAVYSDGSNVRFNNNTGSIYYIKLA